VISDNAISQRLSPKCEEGLVYAMAIRCGKLFFALVYSFATGLVSAKFFPLLQRFGSDCHTMADEPRR